MALAWVEQMDDARRSGLCGVVLGFNTQDRVHAEDPSIPVTGLVYFLATHLARLGFAVAHLSLGTGLRAMTPPGVNAPSPSPFAGLPGAEEPEAILTGIGSILRRPGQKAAIILDHADHIVPQCGASAASLTPAQMAMIETVHGWGADEAIRQAGHFIVLVSHEGGVHSLLTRGGGFRNITIDLPSTLQRDSFLALLLDRLGGSAREVGTLLGDGLTAQALARESGGLRLLDLEVLVRGAFERGKPLARSDLRAAKCAAIQSLCQGLLEIVEPGGGFETVAGARHVKEYFSTVVKHLWQKGSREVPQGILLAGVPGCGKSHLVQALAKELELPVLVMRGIREQWVGASERNLERALQVARNMAPCLVWTDEIDQAVGQRSTGTSADGGTSERLMARLFEFFGSTTLRGKILWVATTNRPDLLDPALLDRFQVVIPFLHPTASERTELLPILTVTLGRRLAPDVDAARLAALPQLESLTVRSLLEIVAAAGVRADLSEEAGGVVKEQHLLEAIAEYIPVNDHVQQELMALKAIEATRFAYLLPWRSGSALNGAKGWPAYLERVVDPATGRPFAHALAARIRELRSALDGTSRRV